MIRSPFGVTAFLFVSLAAHAESGLYASPDQPLSLLAPPSAIADRVSALRKLSDFACGFDLAFESEASDPSMRTTKAQVSISGVPVYGAMVSLHRSTLGGESFSESLPRAGAPSVVPTIEESEALRIASLLSANPLARPAELRLVPNRERTALDLVWWIDFRSTDVGNPGAEILVNANTGAVMGEISKMHTAETVVYNAHQGGLLMKLVGAPTAAMRANIFKLRQGFVPDYLAQPTLGVQAGAPQITGCVVTDTKTGKSYDLKVDECVATIQGKNANGAAACQVINDGDGSAFMVHPENCDLYSTDGRLAGAVNASADTAMDNARTVYDYYSDRFGRRSFDGSNSVLRSVVQVGIGWDNAAWMGDLNFMVYGMGDGKTMGDFTQLIDVAGHEMTHGVVNTTAHLSMLDEPGALNEATADYFGLQISPNNNWEIGAGLYIQKPKEALRSLWNPAAYSDTYIDDAGQKITKPNPAKYSDRYPVTPATQCGRQNDRCFVHMNSTIMSHGYYLINQRLGKSKTENLVFRALTQYYRADTNLHEAANFVRQACGDLYDGGTCAKVDEALKIVEL